MDVPQDCVICLNTINLHDGVITPCKHRYHSDCFFTWIFNHKTCPLCRTLLITNEMNEEEEDHLFMIRQRINVAYMNYDTICDSIREKKESLSHLRQLVTSKHNKIKKLDVDIAKTLEQFQIVLKNYNAFMLKTKRQRQRRRHRMLF